MRYPSAVPTGCQRRYIEFVPHAPGDAVRSVGIAGTVPLVDVVFDVSESSLTPEDASSAVDAGEVADRVDRAVSACATGHDFVTCDIATAQRSTTSDRGSVTVSPSSCCRT